MSGLLFITLFHSVNWLAAQPCSVIWLIRVLTVNQWAKVYSVIKWFKILDNLSSCCQYMQSKVYSYFFLKEFHLASSFIQSCIKCQTCLPHVWCLHILYHRPIMMSHHALLLLSSLIKSIELKRVSACNNFSHRYFFTVVVFLICGKTGFKTSHII